jgi:hypothetical protein
MPLLLHPARPRLLAEAANSERPARLEANQTIAVEAATCSGPSDDPFKDELLMREGCQNPVPSLLGQGGRGLRLYTEAGEADHALAPGAIGFMRPTSPVGLRAHRPSVREPIRSTIRPPSSATLRRFHATKRIRSPRRDIAFTRTRSAASLTPSQERALRLRTWPGRLPCASRIARAPV